MKIRVLSDLHLEFTQYRETLPSIGEDLVVLAGDIGMGSGGVKWALNSYFCTGYFRHF